MRAPGRKAGSDADASASHTGTFARYPDSGASTTPDCNRACHRLDEGACFLVCRIRRTSRRGARARRGVLLRAPYHPRMTPTASIHGALAELASAAGRWLASWWRIVHLGALLLVLALSPQSYDASNRRALLRHVYVGTAPALL